MTDQLRQIGERIAALREIEEKERKIFPSLFLTMWR